MLFHTWEFVFFFAALLPVYLALRRHNAAMVVWLLAVSYLFYGRWNPAYLILIAFCTVMDWFIGLRMGSSPRKNLWLAASIAGNIGFLGFFKYAGFIVENVNALFGSVLTNPAGDFLLPVGISFFTFQSMSYTIDVYRGKIPVERNLLRFAAFVSLFPQLVAGPIERASNLLPQLHGAPRITGHDVSAGASKFLVGLFKKVALADYLAVYVDRVYAAPDQQGAPALLLATFCFAWQIYFDFSGYTDMARGAGQIMGFRFMLNFNNPYVATGLGDFWSRWHISLSTWFKDYVYYPLGGNRTTKLRTYRNMVITMLVSGLWHGAAWGFIIWGALHAAGRVVTRELEATAFWRERVPRLFKQLAVFAFVTFTWIFFRGQTWGRSWEVLRGIFTNPWIDPQCPVLMLGLIGAVWIYQFVYDGPRKRLVEHEFVRLGLAAAMIAYLSIVPQAGSSAFIYFQF